MRQSAETERTQVATREPSLEHLDPLTEKPTNMSHHPQPQGSRSPERQPSDSVNNGGETETATELDIEMGDAEASEERKQQIEEKDPNLIMFDGPNDPENPQNWTRGKKWLVTIVLGSMTFCVTFASSVFSTAIIPVSILYNISTETATLGVSLFVLGFAFGPMIWGPASEVFGRKTPLFIGYFLFAVFQIPVAVAQNVETIMLCRFFGGVFASAPLAIVAGTMADFWDAVDRGVAIVVFAAATFVGPIAGPIMGGFITQSYLGWRWTAWMTLIMASFFGTVGFIIVPESSHPKILQNRAKKIRYETKNWAVHSKLDETQVDFNRIVTVYLFRPLKMLFLEPILFLITIYLALIYGILYLFFEAYPISFQEERHWGGGVGALPFIGIGGGVVLGAITITWVTKTRFRRIMEKEGKVVPEERLLPMILGAFILPIGLFWFAWTSNPHINWVPQVLAGVPIGWGIMMIFLQGLNYIIDVYLWEANSAIAANTLLRSAAGAGFPLFAVAMYHTLGTPWATSLLAFLCIAMIPAPILFYIYGKKIRKMSKFSPSV